ncbi:MAG: hypothetical protein HRT88_17450, partial [Lentisphaeraceae bacterium]|nr:hypothetical protein [Lentisphaeraceae bacterium]
MKDPKILILLVLTQVIFMISAAADEVDTQNEYYKVYQAALQVQDHKNKGYTAIIKYVKTGSDVELSRAAVKVIILAMKKRRSKALTSFARGVLKKFPSENMLGFLKEEPLAKICKKCKGTGKLTARLKCGTCRGKRYIISTVAVPGELSKAIKNLIKLTPQLAVDNGFYIGVGPKPGKSAKVDDESFLPVTDADYAKAEFLNYLKVQERRSQSDIYKSCSVLKLAGKWTLQIIAGKDLLKMN